jgi:Ca-activated chloride channel family protein
MGTIMTRTRASLAAMAAVTALLSVANCSSPQTANERTRDAIIVTGAEIPAERGPIPGAPPPAPPPPPPAMAYAPKMAMGAVAGGSYMRIAPGRIPGDVITEKYPEIKTNPVKEAKTEPVSTFSIDVDTAAYSNVRRFLNEGTLPPKDAVRIEELINYFDYDYALPKTRERPFETSVAMVPSPWSAGKTLLHIGIQSYDIRPAERPALNLVLLLDTSGSMNEDNKLPLVKKAVRVLVDDLTAKDHVAIVAYAGSAGVVLEPTSGADKGKILSALDQLSAGGSTAGGEGIALAYAMAERNFQKGAVNRVIQATDGDFNVGIADPKQLEDFVSRKRESGIYLTELGFGQDNYNDLMMQKLAQAGNGAAAYIDTLAEARKVLHDQMQSALLPIADDVKIQVEFNPARVAEYRLIGYETRMLNREDFNNDSVDAGEIGAGANVTAIYELTSVGGKTLIDPLRYQTPAAATNAAGAEVAFLKIRYKPPGATESILIERPVTNADAKADLAAAPESTRFATAVAAYGQKLRGDPYLDKGYSWDAIVNLANGAKGADEFGWRSEFVQLARAAASAKAFPEPEAPPHPPLMR